MQLQANAYGVLFAVPPGRAGGSERLPGPVALHTSVWAGEERGSCG